MGGGRKTVAPSPGAADRCGAVRCGAGQEADYGVEGPDPLWEGGGDAGSESGGAGGRGGTWCETGVLWPAVCVAFECLSESQRELAVLLTHVVAPLSVDEVHVPRTIGRMTRSSRPCTICGHLAPCAMRAMPRPPAAVGALTPLPRRCMAHTPARAPRVASPTCRGRVRAVACARIPRRRAGQLRPAAKGAWQMVTRGRRIVPAPRLYTLGGAAGGGPRASSPALEPAPGRPPRGLGLRPARGACAASDAVASRARRTPPHARVQGRPARMRCEDVTASRQKPK